MTFDEETAVEQCRRELDCLNAMVTRCITPDDDEYDRTLEHVMHSIGCVSEKLGKICDGHAAELVAPDWAPSKPVAADED